MKFYIYDYKRNRIDSSLLNSKNEIDSEYLKKAIKDLKKLNEQGEKFGIIYKKNV